MITGVVNADHEAIIHLKIKGTNGQEYEVAAVIDTGFNGFLTPLSTIVTLDCAYLSQSYVILADGRMEEQGRLTTGDLESLTPAASGGTL